MNREELYRALEYIRPNQEWDEVNENGSYSFIWKSSTPAPTMQEVNEAHEYLTATAYKELRRVAYPPIGDQLDALWKGGQAAEDMNAIIQAVKAQFPKPE